MASAVPVEAPDGTDAVATEPPLSAHVQLTVGRPRLSRISSAETLSMVGIVCDRVEEGYQIEDISIAISNGRGGPAKLPRAVVVAQILQRRPAREAAEHATER